MTPFKAADIKLSYEPSSNDVLAWARIDGDNFFSVAYTFDFQTAPIMKIIDPDKLIYATNLEGAKNSLDLIAQILAYVADQAQQQMTKDRP